MKKEKLYEVIGDINDNYVNDAHMTAKNTSRPVWFKWYAMAACLCVIVVAVFAILPYSNDNTGDDTVVSSSVADVAPMVFVNNTLYKQSVRQVSYTEMKSDFVYLGKIEEDITSNQSTSNDGVPTEDFQANSPIVGAEVYQYGDNVVILINGEYWLYEILEDENRSEEWDNLSEEEKMQLDPAYNP